MPVPIPPPTSSGPPQYERAITTDDGTPSLFSHEFNEAFHHSSGALLETHFKFIRPAELHHFHSTKLGPLRLLDVCFGLGYNTLATHRLTRDLGLSCVSTGIDISGAPFRYALTHQPFRELWPADLLTHAEGWLGEHLGRNKSQVRWQDARVAVTELRRDAHSYHLIYLDAFSPQVCPELWSIDFLKALVHLLIPGGRIITYSCAAALRSTLRQLGCTLYSISANTPGHWSAGTVAIAPGAPKLWPVMQAAASSPPSPYQSLSVMEQEHLTTTSSIPYRDPTLTASSAAILARRQHEQRRSTLASPSAWRKKWRSSHKAGAMT